MRNYWQRANLAPSKLHFIVNIFHESKAGRKYHFMSVQTLRPLLWQRSSLPLQSLKKTLFAGSSGSQCWKIWTTALRVLKAGPTVGCNGSLFVLRGFCHNRGCAKPWRQINPSDVSLSVPAAQSTGIIRDREPRCFGYRSERKLQSEIRVHHLASRRFLIPPHRQRKAGPGTSQTRF